MVISHIGNNAIIMIKNWIKKKISPHISYIRLREDRKRRGVVTFTWNHSLTLNISGSIEDIF